VPIGLSGFEDVPVNSCAGPRGPRGNFSSIGERADGSNVDLVGEFSNPLSPKPLLSLSSGSGLGVPGKTKVGILVAILDDLVLTKGLSSVVCRLVAMLLRDHQYVR